MTMQEPPKEEEAPRITDSTASVESRGSREEARPARGRFSIDGEAIAELYQAALYNPVIGADNQFLLKREVCAMNGRASWQSASCIELPIITCLLMLLKRSMKG
jgi:hypothetical protein